MSNSDHKFEEYGDMQSYFDKCDDPSDVWDGRISKIIRMRIPIMSTTRSERCRPSNPIDVDHLM